MRILVIPDVHLKSWMFQDADRILETGAADSVVCLGDLLDDWGHQEDAGAYLETLDAATAFAAKYPQTRWCYGNHDIAYLWNVKVSGMAENSMAEQTARRGLFRLYHEIPMDQLAFVHRIDDVLFSHAGISRMFVREQICEDLEGSYATLCAGEGNHDTAEPRDDAARCRIAYDNVDRVVAAINELRLAQLWIDDSPLWLRPQRCYSQYPVQMYRPRRCLQVVGHSPMREITREGNLLSCDVFSTTRDGIPYGTQEFCLIDTRTWEWRGIASSGGSSGIYGERRGSLSYAGQ